MLDTYPFAPAPSNEPGLTYAPGTPERDGLKAELHRLSSTPMEFGHVIAGRELRAGKLVELRAPHNRSLLLAKRFQAGAEQVRMAIDAALEARHDWARMSLHARAAVFLRAAELLAGRYRFTAVAATMLGQSKTAHEAEIDVACELVDFWRFNTHYAGQMLGERLASPRGVWNFMEQRPLEGFVLAITPFNFSSIAGNLPTAPAIMGNTVVWKPAESAVLSAKIIMDVLVEAGLPPGVINLVLGPGSVVGPQCLDHPEFAGIHFTGSTAVFQGIWQTIGNNIARYKGYPRIVGETGGKGFIFAHPSADIDALAVAMVRGAFEYQGQKCSAASRAYVPASMWRALRERLVELVHPIRVGDIADFRNFMGAVIDEKAWNDITGTIDLARRDPNCSLVVGGTSANAEGLFIQPTIVQTNNPGHRLMAEEIFGPVLTVWVYDDARFEEALLLADRTSPYGLTGAFWARDRAAIERAMSALRFSAGNFYINDKPTGAVVGQQPFGGARASGTNDKSGSVLNLLRWISPRAIKENFAPPRDYQYPFMADR